jgi:peroxiredoxin
LGSDSLEEKSLADKKGLTPAKIAVFAVLMFAVGVAGVVAGGWLRNRLSSSKTAMVTSRVPRSLLRQGMVFPDAEIVDNHTELRRTGELIGDRGSIVLFLDLECPPCIKMAVKWQDALYNNMIEEGLVWGISYHSYEVVQTFREENDLHFPIFTDSMQTFLKEYEVNRFPLEVVVGSSGRIRSLSYDSESPIDFTRLAEMLAD